MSAASADAKRRVKLYALNANRQWDDKGTGHVTSCYHEPLDGMSLLVRNESDGSLLLESKIQIDTQYQKQQGTLIVWTESDNYDLALSFQEKDGCNEIWEKICQVQGRDPTYEQQDDEEQEEVRINLVECDQENLQSILDQITAFSQTARRRDVLASEYIENDYIQKLLDIFRKADESQDITTLHKLYEIFKNLFLYDRPTLTEVMLSEQMIMDVIGVFEYEPQQATATSTTTNITSSETAIAIDEDEEAATATTLAASPVPATTQSSASTTETEEETEITTIPIPLPTATITTDTTTETPNTASTPTETTTTTTAAATEAETETPKLLETTAPVVEETTTNRKRHREFLQTGTTFKEVIPFSNQKLVDKIHQTYRVQYLQSSVLPTPSILEENAYASLTNILFFNKVEIVSMIQENGEFLQNLFNQIISSETSSERKRELVLFLREYCMFSQTIQPKQRENFFKTLASYKILSAVEVALSSNDQVIKSAAIDVFTYLVEYNPHMTREHAVQQRGSLIDPPNNESQTANILRSVIEHITTDQDPELGTATQLSCIVRLLLDPENMPDDAIGKHSFLEFFYYTCMQSLVEPIKQATTTNGDIEPAANDRKSAQLLSIMLELLIFFMEHHFSQLRNYIVSSDLLSRITSLIKSRHKFLVLSVIRFFRRLVATKDEVYLDLIMNEDLFSPIIQVLKNNNGRYNLLDSAILEMFEFIQNEDILPLMNHILTNFGPFLDSIEYVDTFKVMRQKKEALHDPLREDTLKPNRSSIENPQMYFGNNSRRDIENLWLGPADSDVGDVNEVDADKDLDPESNESTVDPDGMGLPELKFTIKGTKSDDVEEDEEDDAEDEDDIQMDEDDCDDELEPQLKKKKIK